MAHRFSARDSLHPNFSRDLASLVLDQVTHREHPAPQSPLLDLTQEHRLVSRQVSRQQQSCGCNKQHLRSACDKNFDVLRVRSIHSAGLNAAGYPHLSLEMCAKSQPSAQKAAFILEDNTIVVISQTITWVSQVRLAMVARISVFIE